jgi:hypothetical protein
MAVETSNSRMIWDRRKFRPDVLHINIKVQAKAMIHINPTRFYHEADDLQVPKHPPVDGLAALFSAPTLSGGSPCFHVACIDNGADEPEQLTLRAMGMLDQGRGTQPVINRH